MWKPRDTGYHSRNELRRQTGEYSSSVTPEIVSWNPRLSSALSADVEDAARALVDFDSYALRVLGVDSPAVGPMSAILLRTESASSSQIENLTTSARQIALAEIEETVKPNALTVIGNVRAMEAALALSESIDRAAILAMHRELLSRQRGWEEHAGVFRSELVWIGKSRAGPLGADFVAPQHERVGAAIDDLIAFADRDDLPVLVQVAVAHAQFESVHPFVDGNGRTGRALAQAMLKNKGLVSHTTVPISAGLLTQTEVYFGALERFRAGDAAPIVESFAWASRYAAATGRGLIDRLSEQLESSRSHLRGIRSDAAAWGVLPRLIAQPMLNTQYLRSALGMSTMTAQRALEVLTDRGVLKETTGLRRNRVWQHTGILGVLDQYADDIRRGR
ncbi:cell filamentation protein Fic [Subtercola boreus]|uniref:Cell filamentation protein Fic n=1 Tax=Subtercola boreus TaxID=120213 RepID=A0A3E0WAY5_9MICO|nr:cell filamentation protein Fic [Subtercola boreus]RFA21394.1 cell filamentation protein Fic [Subtercola boreus]RFA27365.1 cell filamentation protein Fic [Subtercola boreus]